MSGKGLFISFEGIDGSGKSTQARLLADHLRGEGREVVLTREPGGSPGAEEIRALVLQGDPDRWSAHTEILLFTAARRDHLERTILPALEAGKVVICDRFADSTRMYQGLSRGDLRWQMAVPGDGILPFDNMFPALMQWHSPHPAAQLTLSVILTVCLGSLCASLLNAASNAINQIYDELEAGNRQFQASHRSANLLLSSPGALVYYLKAIPWLVPGFSVDGYANTLIALHEQAQSQGYALDATYHTYLLIARKPN